VRRLIRKVIHLNRNRKQLGEMVLVVSMIYTYLLLNNVIRGQTYEQETTAGTDN
jgi:hypothetical protein